MSTVNMNKVKKVLNHKPTNKTNDSDSDNEDEKMLIKAAREATLKNESPVKDKSKDIENTFKDKINDVLIEFLKPITEYYKTEYNATETEKDLMELLSLTPSHGQPRSSPKLNRGRTGMVLIPKSRNNSTVRQDNDDEDENKATRNILKCSYLISEGRPNQHYCVKNKIAGSEYCKQHSSNVVIKEDPNDGNIKFDANVPTETTINHSKRFSVDPFNEAEISERQLYVHSNKYLVHSGINKSIHIISTIMNHKGIYVIRELTENDKTFFKPYDKITIDNIDYLYNVVYADIPVDDVPFVPE